MKKILIGFFILLLGTAAKSQNTLKEEYGIVIKDSTSFANFLCATYYTSLDSAESFLYFEEKVLQKLNIAFDYPKRKKLIGALLNNYHKVLNCGIDNSGRLRDNEPLIKRTVGRGEYIFINHLMFYEEDYLYDLNHYEIVDGKKETLLDYVEKILSNPDLIKRYDKDSVRLLHSDLIEYEAKRGSDL